MHGDYYPPDVPHRVFAWNVGTLDYILMYILAAIATAVFLYGWYRHVKAWLMARRTPVRLNVGQFFRDAIAQVKLAKGNPYAGIFHFGIFWGMVILFVTTLLVAAEMDLGFRFIYGDFYLFQSFIADLAGLLLIVGVLLAFARRLFFLPGWLRNSIEDNVILTLLLLLGIEGFLIEALRIAYFQPEWEKVSFVGYTLANLLFSGMSDQAITFWHRILWNVHVWTTMFFIGYIPFSKLGHLFTAPLNILFYEPKKSGQHDVKVNLMELMEKMNAGEEVSEEEMLTGYFTIENLPWKDALMSDACTVCSRCTSVCPAYNTDKPLNPREVVLGVRNHLLSVAEGNGDINESLVAVVGEDALWSCTTCGACVHECPVLIDHLEFIINFRRAAVEEGSYPSELNTAYRGMENQFNPWNAPHDTREEVRKELGVPHISEKPDAEYLIWFGCAANYDQNAKKNLRNLLKILDAAGVSYAGLGAEEKCSGDSARRSGNELLFQMLATENVETLNRYNVKKIITMCPHCYNTIKNEYPAFGGKYEVYHHSEILSRLLSEGRVKVKKDGKSITFHDPCYLGRHNGIFDDPRKVILNVGEITEPERTRERSFCCGAGGGRMWMEETIGKKIYLERTEQLLETGANEIAVACPFCYTMISDGVKAKGKEEEVPVKDIATIIAENLES